jgi:protein involved in polysaccharide export with SLBB domain
MHGQTSPFPDVPVGPNYVLGPGDELRVTVWGSVEGTWEVEVDRDGNINLPKVGALGVTGLKFEELKEVLEKELSKYYTDFNMNVSMGQLKTIRVYVVGNAKAPGTYSVSSLSTIINVLVAAGGPSKSGTMRDIQLKRNGEIVGRLDLYDFLIRGDKTKDERVMPEDVIFIPPIGHIVGVAGDVSRPAIYELKGKAKVTDMIKLAGGTTASSYLQRIQVERVKGNESKVLLDLNLQKVKGKDDIYVEDGDILKIFSINAMVTNKVVLQGNVKRPGEYEWTPGMRVGDIIPSAESLLPNSLLDYGVIERIVPPDFHQEYTTFGLEEMLFNQSEKDNVALQPYDVITVYSKPEIKPQEIVRITGAVNRPGDFEFRQNMKVSDLIKLAGGLKRFAFTRTAELTRTIPTQDGPRTEVITVDLGGALNCDPQCDVELREDDYLLVRSIPDWQLYKKVNIAGEVNFPGEYPLKKGETLSSLIERAGGYTDKAYLRGAVLVRESVRQVQQSQITDMVNRLERELNAMSTADAASVIDASEAKAVAYQQDQKRTLIEGLRRIEAKGRMVVRLDTPKKLKNTPYDITMEETDYLFIPSNPQTVQVLGAVYNPSSFIYIPKKDYSYYIQSAGGYSATADKGEVYVIKVDGSSVRPNKGWFGWNSDANQWVAGYAGIVEPGDTVIVPDRLSTWPWLPRVKDFTTVLYQVAVGAGVLLRTFP